MEADIGVEYKRISEFDLKKKMKFSRIFSILSANACYFERCQAT